MKNKLLKFLLKYEKYLAFVGWVIFIEVAFFQMLKVRGGFITNYGADIIAPLMLYYLIRTNRSILVRFLKHTPTTKQTLILILAPCLLWEISQKFDFSDTLLFFTKGTFDGWDIVAYTVTLSICYYIDLNILKFNQNNPL